MSVSAVGAGATATPRTLPGPTRVLPGGRGSHPTFFLSEPSDHLLHADPGSYAVAGAAASLERPPDFVIEADPGSYTISGSATSDFDAATLVLTPEAEDAVVLTAEVEDAVVLTAEVEDSLVLSPET